MSGAIYNDFSQFTTLRAEATINPNEALEDVAAQFESIFLQQMLKSMRDATVKSGLFESSQMETYQSMADQQLAVQLSEQGGIGLARMMVEQMQTRGLVPESGDDVKGEMTASKMAVQRDVTQVFPPAVANAYDVRSDD
jgi:flagellar protein FlgJ